MKVASRSTAEDSNAFGITCVAELISELEVGVVSKSGGTKVPLNQTSYDWCWIVSPAQLHDKVFLLKVAT